MQGSRKGSFVAMAAALAIFLLAVPAGAAAPHPHDDHPGWTNVVE
jgi:hypothetical protein